MPRLKPKSTKEKPLVINSTSNKTRDYINQFGPNHPGNQGFWGEALTDIPNPSKPGETMNYAQFKEHLKSPEFLSNPEYNDENKRVAYGEQVFKDAQTRFYQKADATPNSYVFPPSASDALNKPVDEFLQKTGGYTTPAQGKAVDDKSNSQRYSMIKDNGVATINKTYAKGTSSIKVKDKTKRKLKSIQDSKDPKLSPLQKAANGLNDVVVPEAPGVGNSLSKAVAGGAAGASAGSSFGPYGSFIGAGVGIIGSTYKDALDPTSTKYDHLKGVMTNTDRKLSRSVDGIEPTLEQKMQVYKKGTNSIKDKPLKKKPSKLIEAEHNEHIFDEDLNHKGVIKGKTHEEGGEVVSVDKGDSIFPANKKSIVDKHLKTGDKTSLKKLRSKLPKDTNAKNQAAFGFNDSDETPDPAAFNRRNRAIKPVVENGAPLYTDNKNRNGQYGNYQSAVDGLNDSSSTYLQIGSKGNPYPYSVVRNSEGTMYKHNQVIPQLKPKNALDTGLTTANTSGVIPASTTINTGAINPSDSGASAINDTTSPIDKTSSFGAGDVLQYANIANNLVRGLQTPKSIEENYLNPDLLKYTDRSETLRRDSRSNQSISNSNARNLSGGMQSNIRANQSAAGTANLERQDSINEREMGRADAVDNANVEIKNDARKVNLGRKDMYQDMKLKQKAVQEDYVNAATQESVQLAEKNKQDNYLRSRDAKEDAKDYAALANLNDTTRYQVDAKTNKATFNPNSGATSSTIPAPKSSTVKTVDKNGRESTKTSTSTAKVKDTTIGDLFGRGLKRTKKLR